MGLFSAIGSFIGGPFGTVLGAGADMLFNANEASKNRSFQASQSNTAYQRAMADMKAAGLNPILAAKIGGASTPSGAVAAGSNMSGAMGTAFSNQSQRMQTEANVEKIDQEVENLGAQLELTQEQTQVAKETVRKVQAEVEYIKANKGYREAVTAIPKLVSDYLDAYVPSAGNSAGFFERTGEQLGAATYKAHEAMKKGLILIIKKAAGLTDEFGE